MVSELCSAAMLLPCKRRNCRRQRAAVQLGGQLCGDSVVQGLDGGRVVAGRRSVYRQVRYLSVRGESEGQLPCGDVRAVTRTSGMLPVTGPSNMFTYRRLSPVDIPQSAGSAASVLERGRLRGFGLGVAFRRGSVFDTTPPHRHRFSVCQTHQPLFGASFRKYVSQSVGDLASEARTRPAPGPRQGFFRM